MQFISAKTEKSPRTAVGRGLSFLMKACPSPHRKLKEEGFHG
jgi:hypothetical protein